jgi:hypothetical protein
MSPANFQVRPRSKRRFIAPIAVGVLAVSAILIYIGSRGGVNPKPTPSASASALQFKFAATKFKPVFEGKAPSSAAIDAERRTLEDMFTGYYRATFVDPTAWKDATFAAQQTIFTPEARASFAKDVAALTIGEGAADIASITPGATSLTTSVYWDGGGAPKYAVAAIVFKATAKTKDGRTLNIAQNGTYRLQRSGNSWIVFSYEADAKQDTPPSPSPSPSPTATTS